MRTTLSALLIATLVTACGGPQLTPAQKAQRATNIAQNNAAISTAKAVRINGKVFRVAHVTERNQALVDLVGAPTPYFAADVEAAARAVTGCNGTFEPGILAFVGGNIAEADLGEIRKKISSTFNGWAVKLSC